MKETKSKNKKSRTRASLKRSNNSIVKRKIEKKTENDIKNKKGKALLIAQEINFVRSLANNDKKVRDKVLKSLKRWLIVRSQSSFVFTEADFMRIWKGLFYCMWMSDKPLVQEDLAESISKIVHCFCSKETVLLYTKCSFQSLSNEWFGIDRFRLDKFQMLVRKILRQTFTVCKKQSWDKEWIQGVANVIKDVILNPKTSLGFNLHLSDIYMEELAKVSEGKISESSVTEFVKPFVMYLVAANDHKTIKLIIKNIFRYLILQSNTGLDYLEKFEAWRDAGFPCKSVDEMQLVGETSNGEEEEDLECPQSSTNSSTSNKPLDPRAGRVDVEIPQLPFNSQEIAELLKKNKFNESSSTLSRKNVNQLINQFTELSKGIMPIGIKEIDIPEKPNLFTNEAAQNLVKLDEELYTDSNRNLNKKKRKREIESEDNLNEITSLQNFASKNDKSKSELAKKQKLNNKKIKTNISTKKKSKKLLNNFRKFPLDNSISNDESNTQNFTSKWSVTCSSNSINEHAVIDSKTRLTKTSSVATDAVVRSIPSSSNKKETITESHSLNSPKNGAYKSNISLLPNNLEKKDVTKKMSSPKKTSPLLNKKELKLLKSKNTPWLTPVLTRLEEQKKDQHIREKTSPVSKKSPKASLQTLEKVSPVSKKSPKPSLQTLEKVSPVSKKSPKASLQTLEKVSPVSKKSPKASLQTLEKVSPISKKSPKLNLQTPETSLLVPEKSSPTIDVQTSEPILQILKKSPKINLQMLESNLPESKKPSPKIDLKTPDTNSPLSKKSKVELRTPEPILSVSKKSPKLDLQTPESILPILKKLDSSVKKRVKIELKNNTEQHTSEYFRQLRQSPGIPFDANRKPKVGVLKPSPLPSPINPFYKRKLNM